MYLYQHLLDFILISQVSINSVLIKNMYTQVNCIVEVYFILITIIFV